MYTKTTFPFFESGFKIRHNDLIYSCGSCFASELSVRLDSLRFKIIRHPFGIVYNPLSIAQQLDKLFAQNFYTESDLITHNGLFHSLEHHSSFSSPDKNHVLDQLNRSSEEAFSQLKNCRFLVLTLGSSFYYRLNSNQQVVANCHKLPSNLFNKNLASLEEIYKRLHQVIDRMLIFNPSLQILLSVSPVRYLKDGYIENQRSKSRLILACEQLCNQFESCTYIPAYEIFMDDLRDYRYVKDDLVHPNQMAIDYIFNYFEQAYFNKETRTLVAKIKKWNQLSSHRVLHAESEAYAKYYLQLEQLQAEIELEIAQIS